MLMLQIISVLGVITYSFIASLLIALFVKVITGLRVPAEVEEAGIDAHIYGENAYALD